MTTYKDAGVDIDLANKSIDSVKNHIKSTFNKNTISDLGALYRCFIALLKSSIHGSAQYEKSKLKCDFAGTNVKSINQL